MKLPDGKLPDFGFDGERKSGGAGEVLDMKKKMIGELEKLLNGGGTGEVLDMKKLLMKIKEKSGKNILNCDGKCDTCENHKDEKPEDCAEKKIEITGEQFKEIDVLFEKERKFKDEAHVLFGKIKLLEAQMNDANNDAWRKVKELYPEIGEGHWTYKVGKDGSAIIFKHKV